MITAIEEQLIKELAKIPMIPSKSGKLVNRGFVVRLIKKTFRNIRNG